MEILNITNGSATISLMEQAGVKGEKLSWDDLLHEGPVPRELSLQALSKVRADFIVSAGYASDSQVQEKFSERDKRLTGCTNYQQVVLWFEHDLYDQLQLIQLLDWFNCQPSISVDLRLIQVDKHLGYHSPLEISLLENTSRPVDKEQLLLASEAWRALTSDSPRDLNQFLKGSLTALPNLKAALIRLVMEYPDSRNGLPFTETLILRCLQQGPLDPGGLFRAYTAIEEAQFMGDTTFWMRLNQMAFCEHPPIALQKISPIRVPVDAAQKIMITPYGNNALAAKVDWFDDNQLSKWVGGCHLSPDNPWRWQATNGQVELKS